MQPPETIDLLIEARWIIPVEPADTTLEHHALAVDGGRIVALLPIAQAKERYHPRRRLSLEQHLLIPGLINLHTHAAMTLLRGYADDMALMDWLTQRIWPAEHKHMSADFVHDGTLLACAEMLRGGITCFNDMYFYPEAAAAAALQLGMRAALGMVVLEFPSAYAADADDYLAKGLAARDALRDEALISFCMAPHAPYTVSDRSLERIMTLANQLDLPIHMHLHETRAEIADSLKQYGLRPLARLQRMGFLGPNLIAVHAVHLEAEELALLAEQGCSVAHCPTSNMKLASGIAPITALHQLGVRVGLGSDSAASNNRLDLMREMHQAALLAKVATGDATALAAHQVLRMATLEGAAALGLDSRIGSLSLGKEADLCAIRLDDSMLNPCYNPASHMVYAAGREQVSHVWVKGVELVSEGILKGGDAARLLDLAHSWHNILAS